MQFDRLTSVLTRYRVFDWQWVTWHERTHGGRSVICNQKAINSAFGPRAKSIPRRSRWSIKKRGLTRIKATETVISGTLASRRQKFERKRERERERKEEKDTVRITKQSKAKISGCSWPGFRSRITHSVKMRVKSRTRAYGMLSVAPF